ncbi:class I SAM-dependent methyltransferase [Phenylobacterium sp.]|uniref:class I SAM-dependent methyltransferase n=1 Tax=Phenylobacterium sp. TaxID=1871053 RepID=UPI00301BF9B6
MLDTDGRGAYHSQGNDNLEAIDVGVQIGLAGRIGGLVRRALRSRSSSGQLDLKASYVAFVDDLKARLPNDRAMELAIGDGFDTIGPIEAGLIAHYGLPPDDGYLIDVGCGSGRLAQPLARTHRGRYLGIDLVPALVEHARKITERPDWSFKVIDHIGVPEKDGQADMVCFFSVLTHLLHEQSYWYLEEAKRVLKPGGTVVFSFLEFHEPGHLPIFRATLEGAKARTKAPLNVFIERNAIRVWTSELGMEMVELRDAGDAIVPQGALGQSICVLRKPVG